MKRTQRCIKCNGAKLWLVDPFRIPGAAGEAHDLAVAGHLEGKAAGFFEFPTANPVGRFELWLCASCGYSELWAKDFESIHESDKDGVRLVDTTVEGSGPFR